MDFTKKELEFLRGALRNELTENVVYERMARLQKDPRNRAVLEQIGKEEGKHAEMLSSVLKEEGRPRRFPA